MSPFKDDTDILQQNYQWWPIGKFLFVPVFLFLFMLYMRIKPKIGSQKSKVKLEVIGVGFDMMMEQLNKINISTKRKPPKEVKATICVRYHGFRIDSDVAESLQRYEKEQIKRTILIILHRHNERAHYLHGKVQDPEMIPFSETETPNYKDYKMLKGIIHIHVGPKEKNIFENSDAEKQLKIWIKEIEDGSR